MADFDRITDENGVTKYVKDLTSRTAVSNLGTQLIHLIVVCQTTRVGGKTNLPGIGWRDVVDLNFDEGHGIFDGSVDRACLRLIFVDSAYYDKTLDLYFHFVDASSTDRIYPVYEDLDRTTALKYRTGEILDFVYDDTNHCFYLVDVDQGGGTIEAEDVDYDNTVSGLTATDVQAAIDELADEKVDKVTGKGLSEEDFTTTYKTKLDSINAGAEVNVQSNWTEADTTSDAYIRNKPTIPSALSDLSEDSTHRVVTDTEKSTWSGKVSDNPSFTEASTRANIASGESFATILGKIKKFFADLKTVAFTGSYSDLSNKPTIPAAQVNSDWDAASGVAQILNKPSLATVATSGDYDDLINKPTIPSDTWRPMSYLSNTSQTQVQIPSDKPLYFNPVSANVQFEGFDSGTEFNLVMNVDLSGKQDTLVSGTNIKTVNGNSIVGSGDVATASNISSYALPVQDGTDFNSWITVGGDKCVACPQNAWKSIGSVEFPAGTWLFKAYVYFYTNANGYRGLCISETKNTGTIDMLVPAVSGIQTGLSTSKIIHVASGTKRFFITVLHNAGGDLYTFPHFDAVKLSS